MKLKQPTSANSHQRSVRSPRFSFWLASLTAAGLLSSGAASLRAQTATWNGGTGNWSNASLWSPNTVPNGAGFDVQIDGGKTSVASVVSMDGSYTFHDLTLDAGDTLNVLNGYTPTLTDTLTNNGTVNLSSTGSGVSLFLAGPSISTAPARSTSTARA